MSNSNQRIHLPPLSLTIPPVLPTPTQSKAFEMLQRDRERSAVVPGMVVSRSGILKNSNSSSYPSSSSSSGLAGGGGAVPGATYSSDSECTSSDQLPTPKHTRFDLPDDDDPDGDISSTKVASSTPSSSVTVTPSPTITITQGSYASSESRSGRLTSIEQRLAEDLEIIMQDIFEEDILYDSSPDLSSPSSQHSNTSNSSHSSQSSYNPPASARPNASRLTTDVPLHPFRYSIHQNPAARARAQGPGSLEYEMWIARLEYTHKKSQARVRNANMHSNPDALSDDEDDETHYLLTGRHRRPHVYNPSPLAGRLDSHPLSMKKRNLDKEEFVFGCGKERREVIGLEDPRHGEYMRDGYDALERGFREADVSVKAAKARRKRMRKARKARKAGRRGGGGGVDGEWSGSSASASGSSGSPSSGSGSSSTGSGSGSSGSPTSMMTASVTLPGIPTRNPSRSIGLRSLFTSQSASARLNVSHSSGRIDGLPSHSSNRDNDNNNGTSTNDGYLSEVESGSASYESDSRLRRTLSTLSLGLTRSWSRSSPQFHPQLRRNTTRRRRRRDSDTDSFIVNSVVNVSRSRSHGDYLQSQSQSSSPTLRRSRSGSVYRSFSRLDSSQSLISSTSRNPNYSNTYLTRQQTGYESFTLPRRAGGHYFQVNDDYDSLASIVATTAAGAVSTSNTLPPPTRAGPRRQGMHQIWSGIEQAWSSRVNRIKTRVKDLGTRRTRATEERQIEAPGESSTT